MVSLSSVRGRRHVSALVAVNTVATYLRVSDSTLWSRCMALLMPLSVCGCVQDNKSLYPAHQKVISHLTAVSEELVDVPLYFSLHEVCKTVRCTPPKADILRSAIINADSPTFKSCAVCTRASGRSSLGNYMSVVTVPHYSQHGFSCTPAHSSYNASLIFCISLLVLNVFLAAYSLCYAHHIAALCTYEQHFLNMHKPARGLM